ncbi:MAG: hypothetical protein WA989_02260, partial [Henriciella sp.]|uniref:hypothetical protein n=1 Tax=Henriciella sp. TaxID=1968823 RepID=UPI003C741B2E
MKTHILFTFIALIVLGLVIGYREYHPEPPADYEIYYFGSTQCSACKTWKTHDLAIWKDEDAFGYALVRMVEITPSSTRNGNRYHGRYGEVF